MRKLWIDTDIGGDCDDAGALAIAALCARRGDAEVLGVSFVTSAAAGPACIDAIERYYGYPDLPIGATSRRHYCDGGVHPFQAVVAKRCPNRYYLPEADAYRPCEDAVSLIRRTLAAQPDGSVEFVCIGQLGNAADLLDSPPDAYAPYDGVELVRRKVREFAVMGGLFSEAEEKLCFEGAEYRTEYNIACDVDSARSFVERCPVRIVFCDFKVGYRVMTGRPFFTEQESDHPVALAYRMFQGGPRESWDPLTVWYAVYGTSELFVISPEGRVTVEPDGLTVFDRTTPHQHYYLRLAQGEDETANRIDQFIMGGNQS